MKKNLLTSLGILLLITTHAVAMDIAQLRTTLQASLQRNIDRTTVEGAILHVDLGTGDAIEYFPTDAHKMILSLGQDGLKYVMCGELSQKDGSRATVDYYLVKNGRGFTVVRTEIANRDPLKKLVQVGTATHLN